MSGSGPTNAQQAAIAQAMAAVSMPQLFFNGFAHNHTASELSSILSFGAKPLLTLVMPPVVAKTFALSLLENVQRYEAATGTTVNTIPELNERIAAHETKAGP